MAQLKQKMPDQHWINEKGIKITKKKIQEQKKISETARKIVQDDKGQATPIAKYLSELRSLITKNKEYPAMAKRLHQEGTVMIKFTIMANGKICNIVITKKASFDTLNKEAIKTINRIGVFKTFPKEITKEKLEIAFPIEFKIS